MPSSFADEMPVSDRPLPGRLREARSNDVAVLAAAREVFSERGHGASIADVARHAGVGVGSIYRRYATKEALVEALHLHAVRDAAERAADVGASVGESTTEGVAREGAVARFLSRQIIEAAGPLIRPSGMAGPIPADLAAASDDLRRHLDVLIAHDQAARLVPTGFTPADAMQLIQHLRPTLPSSREESDALHLRYLAFIVDGLRAKAEAGVVLADGPDWDSWVGAWHQ